MPGKSAVIDDDKIFGIFFQLFFIDPPRLITRIGRQCRMSL